MVTIAFTLEAQGRGRLPQIIEIDLILIQFKTDFTLNQFKMYQYCAKITYTLGPRGGGRLPQIIETDFSFCSKNGPESLVSLTFYSLGNKCAPWECKKQYSLSSVRNLISYQLFY